MKKNQYAYDPLSGKTVLVAVKQEKQEEKKEEKKEKKEEELTPTQKALLEIAERDDLLAKCSRSNGGEK